MEKLLSPDELADLLSVKKSLLYQLTHARSIPFVRVGGLLRFRPSAIDAWLDNKLKPGSPAAPTGDAKKTAQKAKKSRSRDTSIDQLISRAKAEAGVKS